MKAVRHEFNEPRSSRPVIRFGMMKRIEEAIEHDLSLIVERMTGSSEVIRVQSDVSNQYLVGFHVDTNDMYRYRHSTYPFAR